MKFTNRRIANTIIISTLLVASIASIGFSSWLIGKENSDSVNIDASVGNVEDGTLFGIGKISMFGIGEYGLVSNDKFVSSSSFSIEIIVYSNELYNKGFLYSENSKYYLDFRIYLSCSDENFLSSYITNNPTISGSLNIEKVTTTDGSFSHLVKYEIQDISSDSETLSTIYAINDSNNSIKNYYGNTPNFSFKVGLAE